MANEMTVRACRCGKKTASMKRENRQTSKSLADSPRVPPSFVHCEHLNHCTISHLDFRYLLENYDNANKSDANTSHLSRGENVNGNEKIFHITHNNMYVVQSKTTT